MKQFIKVFHIAKKENGYLIFTYRDFSVFPYMWDYRKSWDEVINYKNGDMLIIISFSNFSKPKFIKG